MLHNTLSALLVSVASRYAELSPSDVGIGIGGGRLVIDNVKLRAETLNSHRLPFHIYEGRAGRLRVNVPWSALSSSPVQLYLENIHLIAGPKQTFPSSASPHVPAPTAASAADPKAEWHQTIVGRLLFNVSIELYGLKVEYRDDECVAILSIASMKAFSTGPDWQIRFVSLVEDSDPDADDATTALPMRKLVRLSGVHCVMIPRLPHAASNDPLHSAPLLNRHSFESRAPILDGIPITVRVLVCTGTTHTQENPHHISSGLHLEVDIDLEEPHVSLTARQMVWIDRILKQGFGMGANTVQTVSPVPMHQLQQQAVNTRRKPRPIPPELANPSLQSVESVSLLEHAAQLPLSEDAPERPDGTLNAGYPLPSAPPSTLNTENTYSPPYAKGLGDDLYLDENVDEEIEKISDYDDENYYEDDLAADVPNTSNSRLSSLWRAIISENSDETIDDAAIALGLISGDDLYVAKRVSTVEAGPDQTDYAYARNAVEAAANAGGVTVQLRLRTPDSAAQDFIERLQEELRLEREMRARLGGVESILEEAEERVRLSEKEVEQLKARIAALVRELEDLERMTSQAGKNKDAMIRQMEAALAKAERNLQAMYQAEFDRQRRGRRLSSPAISAHAHREVDVLGSLDKQGIDMHLKESPDVHDGSSAKHSDENVGRGQSERGSAEFEKDDGNGHVGSIPEEAAQEYYTNSSVVDSAGEEVRTERHDDDELVSPRAATEVAERGHVEEAYYSKVSSQQLEEAISSEGLTLI